MWCLAVQELKCVQCLHTTSVVVMEIMYEPLTQYTTHLTISGTRKYVLINCRAEVSGCGVLVRRWSVLNNVWKNGECNMIIVCVKSTHIMTG